MIVLLTLMIYQIYYQKLGWTSPKANAKATQGSFPQFLCIPGASFLMLILPLYYLNFAPLLVHTWNWALTLFLQKPIHAQVSWV